MSEEMDDQVRQPAIKSYEKIGCQEAGGKTDLDKVLEYFSDRCAQSCPNWNLCNRMANQA